MSDQLKEKDKLKASAAKLARVIKAAKQEKKS